jgi:hypothetical protein
MRAPKRLLPSSLLLLVWSAFGYGQAVYKSVDAQGNVSYSNTRPSDAPVVQPMVIRPDAPAAASAEAERLRTDVDKQAAEEQKRRDEQRAQKMQRAAAVGQAEKRLKEARDALEATKQQREAERKSLDRGTRVDNLAVSDRIKQQALKVREAERALSEAKTAPLPATPETQSATPPAQTKGATPPAGGAPAAPPDTRG